MRSLTFRLVLLSGLWASAGLAVCGWFVADLAAGHIEAAADARLQALLDSVVAATGTDAEGRPRLTREVSEPEFDRPLSGTYWQVDAAGGVARSRSLWDATLPAPAATVPGLVQADDLRGPRGEALRRLLRVIEAPEAAGPLAVQVAVSRAGTDATVAGLRRTLLLAFGGLGLGLVAGLAALLLFGLRPLRAARDALAEVRTGARQRLDLAAPSEIAPLVAEIDALVAQNQATVERARAHLGNLAHALKTPVAVLRNALEATPPQPAEAARQAQALQHIVQHHLARARAMAVTSAANAAAPVAVAEELASALRRLQADRALRIDVFGDAAARVRADRQDLMEMLGNLMENACRWAASQVRVTVVTAGEAIAVTVEDDGPGLPAGDAAAAQGRGIRLDEAAPGTGLGLAITTDLALLLGGNLMLDGSAQLGGLAARLQLPAAPRGAWTLPQG